MGHHLWKNYWQQYSEISLLKAGGKWVAGVHSGAHFPLGGLRLGLKPEFGGCFLGIFIAWEGLDWDFSTISSGCSQMFTVTQKRKIICQY